MCGIVGMVHKDNVNQLIYDALLLLQHRGQDAAGIATQDQRKFFMYKAKGMGFGQRRAVLLLWAMTVVIWLTPLHKEAWWKQGQAAPWLDTSLRWAAPLLPATFQEWLPPALRARPSV